MRFEADWGWLFGWINCDIHNCWTPIANLQKVDCYKRRSFLCSINEHGSSPMLNILSLWWRWRKSGMLHNIPSFNEAFVPSNIRQLSGIKKTGSRIWKVIRNVSLRGNRRGMKIKSICLHAKYRWKSSHIQRWR